MRQALPGTRLGWDQGLLGPWRQPHGSPASPVPLPGWAPCLGCLSSSCSHVPLAHSGAQFKPRQPKHSPPTPTTFRYASG